MKNNPEHAKFSKIFIIYFAILLIFVGIRIASNFGLFDALKNEFVADAVSTIIIQLGILFVVPFVLYLALFKKKPRQVFQDFGYKKLGFKAIMICFGIGILAFVLNLFVSNFFAIILRYIGYNPTYSSSGSGYDTFPKFLFGVLFVAILPALFEEFVHRGLILRGTSSVVGYRKAIIISSLLFGLMHLNISQFFYATILGILMGFVATMTRSIWPAVIIHFCNNFINVLLSYLETTKLSSFSITGFLNSVANHSVVLFFILVTIIILLALVGIFFLLKKLFMETGYKRYAKMFNSIEQNIRSNDENISDKDVAQTFERYVFPKMKEPGNFVDLYVDDTKTYSKLGLKHKIPLVCCLVMSILITVYTFIWGVV